MHLVMRSSLAKGAWSFRQPKNRGCVNRIIEKFSFIYGVRVISMANVGNHLHLQIKLSNRFGYRPFIRAVTAAIAMAITGRNRWTHGKSHSEKSRLRFWDQRPFTRIVIGLNSILKLRDYVRVNQLEGDGYSRSDAEFMLKVEKSFAHEPD